MADEAGLRTAWIETSSFRHLVLLRERGGSHLRVYVEGDGLPWVSRYRVAIDPTPTNPLMLRLMLSDPGPGPVAYLGRPCYFGTAADEGCGSRWWTFDRYGPNVVDSMCEALTQLASVTGVGTVHLLGHSGGGTIVVAMKKCVPQLESVTTIAGNLTPHRWTDYHDYSPLNFESAAFDAEHEAAEIHWQCGSDRNIPPMITDDYFAANLAAQRVLIEECSHSNGWAAHWLRIIAMDGS